MAFPMAHFISYVLALASQQVGPGRLCQLNFEQTARCFQASKMEKQDFHVKLEKQVHFFSPVPKWWKFHDMNDRLPNWTSTYKKILFVQQASAAVEYVFSSFVERFFLCQQEY